ncbi:MAG: hypothetical protein ABIH50_06010 [bacterium]
MKFRHLLLVGWLVSWLVLPSLALEIGGYYENDAVVGFNRHLTAEAGNINRLRLKIKAGSFYFEPRYYYFPATQSMSLAGTSDLDRLVWDKAYFKFSNFTIGKQRIAWGTGYIWNPTDIFNPFVMAFSVREEDETNVEAVRLEIPLGLASGIDAYVQSGKEWSNSVKGIRVKNNIGRFDYSGSFIDLGSGSSLVGFDSAGELFGLGVRQETAYRSPAGGPAYLQTMLGADYTFENGTYINSEYYFNGLGKNNKSNYDWTSTVRGRDYLYLGVSRSLDEITRISGSVLINLNDTGFLFYPSYARNLSQNVDVYLEAALLSGPAGSEYCPPPAQDPTGYGNSKFGLVRIRYSF